MTDGVTVHLTEHQLAIVEVALAVNAIEARQHGRPKIAESREAVLEHIKRAEEDALAGDDTQAGE